MESKYARLVEAAQRNAKSVWELADEVLTVCPNRAPDEVKAAHAALVEAGYEYTIDRLKTLAYTAERWPKGKRCLEASFKAHEVLNAREDRFELIEPNMTLTEAHRAAGHSTAARTSLGDGGPNSEIIAAAASDPDAMRSLVNNESFRSAFLERFSQEAAQDREHERSSQDHRAPGLTKAHRLATIHTDLNRYAAGVARIVESLQDETLTDEQRKGTLERARTLHNATGWLISLMEGDARSFDTEVAALLRDSA